MPTGRDRRPRRDGARMTAADRLARVPGYRAVRFARMAGSTLAAPDAAGWVTDFLNAAYYARPAAARDVADLRLALGVVTTRWHRLGRRLHAHDAIAFHRAFGADRFLRSPRLTLAPEQLLAGAERLLGAGFPAAWADGERRGWGVAFEEPAGRSAYDPERRLRDAALGPITPPAAATRRWSTYPPVPLPSAEATIAALSDPSRWPDFGCALGRFTALRDRGLAGQTFEIEVVAHPAPRTPVFTRGYVTATGLHDDPATIAEILGAAELDEPALPAGATPRILLELTTHGGHFLGAAVSRLVIWEDADGAWIRDVGEWDPLPAHLAVPFRLAGRAAQHAFWGGGAPHESMLHQLALAASAPGVSGSAGTPTETDRPPNRPLNARR